MKNTNETYVPTADMAAQMALFEKITGLTVEILPGESVPCMIEIPTEESGTYALGCKMTAPGMTPELWFSGNMGAFIKAVIKDEVARSWALAHFLPGSPQ